MSSKRRFLKKRVLTYSSYWDGVWEYTNIRLDFMEKRNTDLCYWVRNKYEDVRKNEMVLEVIILGVWDIFIKLAFKHYSLKSSIIIKYIHSYPDILKLQYSLIRLTDLAYYTFNGVVTNM